ncbi:MAG TPA: hypothetical protein VEC60_09400 [Reyranella sp.]|nr:hypothetical protein [Reyranella sp.]
MQMDLQRRASLKREMAARFREIAPGLSLHRDRELFLREASELEQQADELDRGSAPLRRH